MIILGIIVLKGYLKECLNFTFYAVELNFVRRSPSSNLPKDPPSGEPDTQDKPGEPRHLYLEIPSDRPGF